MSKIKLAFLWGIITLFFGLFDYELAFIVGSTMNGFEFSISLGANYPNLRHLIIGTTLGVGILFIHFQLLVKIKKDIAYSSLNLLLIIILYCSYMILARTFLPLIPILILVSAFLHVSKNNMIGDPY